MAAVAATADEIKKRYGKIDILLNNAGLTYKQDGSVELGAPYMKAKNGMDLSIAGEGGRSFLETFAFPVSPYGPGVTSSINAILRTDEELKEGDALDDGKCFIEVLAPFIKLDFLKNSKFGWSYTVVEIFCDNSTGRSTIYS